MTLWPARKRPADESDLMGRLAAGDRQALDLIYRAEAAEVYRFAVAMCGNPAWAADAVQDAFIQLAEKPGGYDRTQGPLRAYLCGIARYKLLARWREASPFSTLEEEDEGAADVPHTHTPEIELARTQETHSLWREIARLPWVFREAVVLVDIQERSYTEAAQIAGVETNTLRTRLHRARKRLAEALAPNAMTTTP
ncbi:RNA polymerase sigma factor [Ramlibacter sp. PS4R-6]|uniref:RNA polymerase sigma factor n=1 Tax=Ramlibacter sp. PS4R-6 TaxID=3133438 RepID=UPI0030A48261